MTDPGLDPTLGAILPLVGVVVGAAIAGAIQYALKRRDERRELRAVARLIDEELGEVQLGIEVAQQGLAIGSVATETWQQHKMLLARHLTFAEWDRLRGAYSSLGLLAVAEGKSEPRAWAELLRGFLILVRDGRSVVAAKAKAPPLEERPRVSITMEAVQEPEG